MKSETYHSPGRETSDIQNRLDAMGKLALDEEDGIHTDAVLEQIDPTPNQRLAHVIEDLNPVFHEGIFTTVGFFSKKKALIRRRSRRVANQLLNRRHP